MFAKFNSKIFIHPPPYEREIRHCNKANTDVFRRSIDEFCWENRFSNTDANLKVYLFHEIIKNILSNFIPHETIVCDDRNPPWINSKIRKLIFEKKYCYLQNNSDIQLLQRFQSLQNLLTVTIEKSKEQFYSQISSLSLVINLSPLGL